MYLINTVLKDGTQFTIEFTKNQKNKSDVPVTIDLNTVTIKGDFRLLTKFPVGAHFIVKDIKWGEIESIITGSIIPMFFESTVYGRSASPDVTQKEVEYVLEWLMANKTQEETTVYAEQFKAMGFDIDIDRMYNEYREDESVTFKEQIMRNYPCPTPEEIQFHIDPEVWYVLVRNVLKGENSMLLGPTGSGKTELITHIAKAMGKELNYQDMGTIQDAQSALIGVHRLNKSGHSDFDYAPFVEYVQKDNIILADEINRAPLSANNILFPCLDRRRYLPLDVAGSEGLRKVNLHPNCVFFATANLGAEYTGTSQIDRALFDRFFAVELDYPAQDAEVNILQIRTGVNEKAAKAIVKVGSTIREQFKSQELSNVMSVRHTLLAAQLVKDGFDTVTSLTKVILPLFEDSSGMSERSKVKSIIAAN